MAKAPTVSLTDALGSLSEGDTSGEVVTSFLEQSEISDDSGVQGTTILSALPEMILTKHKECTFDFGETPQHIVSKVKSLHRRVYDKVHDAIIGAGEDLLRMKKLIKEHSPKGTWTQYLKTGSPILERSARHYMAAAEARARLGPSATVAEKLPLTVLYKIPTAPGEVVDEIVRRVEANETVDPKTFQKLLGSHASARSAAVPTTTPAKVSQHAETTVVGSDGDRDNGEDVDQQRASAMAEIEAAPSSSEAALELIAQLREHYNDEKIIKLDELWQAVGPGALRQYLTPTAM